MSPLLGPSAHASKFPLVALIWSSLWLVNVLNGNMVKAFAPLSRNCMLGRAMKHSYGMTKIGESRLWNSQDDDDGDEYILSPQQVKVLRKEVQKRKANKSLKRLSLTEDEGSGAFTDETLQLIASTFNTQTELLEIRGISKGKRERTRAISEMLAIQVERAMTPDDNSSAFKPVFVLETSRGHSAILYSPFLEDTDIYENNRVVLRSGFVKNKWTRKPKAVRDVRGQILKDEDGNIIRE